jgi:hypothetical protein
MGSATEGSRTRRPGGSPCDLAFRVRPRAGRAEVLPGPVGRTSGRAPASAGASGALLHSRRHHARVWPPEPVERPKGLLGRDCLDVLAGSTARGGGEGPRHRRPGGSPCHLAIRVRPSGAGWAEALFCAGWARSRPRAKQVGHRARCCAVGDPRRVLLLSRSIGPRAAGQGLSGRAGGVNGEGRPPKARAPDGRAVRRATSRSGSGPRAGRAEVLPGLVGRTSGRAPASAGASGALLHSRRHTRRCAL